MIISKTPFRISLAGGGTDLRKFYANEPGAVLSFAIDKYMYITVNRYFDDSILLKYSKTELVDSLQKIRHPLLRECLRKSGLSKGIEMTSMADIPGGTGLGSSSSFTVGTLHALSAFKGEFCAPDELAQWACEIEIEKLQEPIGKQDQYIAAYGGFQFIEFMPDESVKVNPLILSDRTRKELFDRMILLYTGIRRKASSVLRKARSNFHKKQGALKRLRDLAYFSKESLQKGDVESLGAVLHEGWEIKKSLACEVSNPKIDEAYLAALKSGASGGKILGAGGGGFLLLFCPPAKRSTVLNRLKGWREIPFRFEPEGSKIIHMSR
jgi:D-glycero-alpha-D-manno-heptose-7-phosphate kinase